MANRRTVNDVINPGANPLGGSQFGATNPYKNQENSFILGGSSANKSAAELRTQNEKLKAAIAAWNRQKPVLQQQRIPQQSNSQEFQRRIYANNQKISDLNMQIAEQNEVMSAYRAKFNQFQDNLNKLMRLDKDIHKNLVNPQQSPTFQNNVRNLMVAVNSGAPYNICLDMINKIKF